MIPPFPAKSSDHVTYLTAKNFIGGEISAPQRPGETLPVMNPRFGKPVGHVMLSSAADVDSAVRAAEKALPDWSERPIRERAQVLYRFRQLLCEHVEELSWLVHHENGKTYAEGKAELEKTIECCEYGCSLPNIAVGEKLEVSRGVTCETHYSPLGVVAGITPFNFPAMVPMWMMPQALVGGNAFILKPSERVPLSTQRMAALLDEAGMPKGIFSIVQGTREVVEALCDHQRVKAVGFVGSTKVARLVYARAAAAGKRALCLGGAKNHLILAPDANVEMTSENVASSFTGGTGQRCMAASVLVAVGDCDHLIEAIRARAEKLVAGTDVGPVISEAARARIRGYIDGAEKLGAKVILDGRNANPVDGGYWIGPTILDHVRPDMPAASEEIFGPVLSIVRVPNLEAALALENGNPYGNAACIYTESGDIARRAIARVEAGMCGVNVGVPVPREPFGFAGWNDSAFGAGNMTGWDGYRFWTRQRKVTSKWAQPKNRDWMS
jgi:malonate-semialdehyde dehydrogenase (acetylating)/methylmalonate-semialdehyde dehydrogenase